MKKQEDEVIDIFKQSGALLEGHFLLRSGLHSAHFFQCAQVCQFMDKVTRLAELMIPKLREYDAQTIVGPAMGGLSNRSGGRSSNGFTLRIFRKSRGSLSLKT